MPSFENLFNKGGLKTTLLRRLRDYSFRPPDVLWSRGWSYFADYAGDGSFLYPAFPTRYCVADLKHLRKKSGLIWLRQGSYPIKEDWGAEHESRLGDIATFARDVVGHLGGNTVLITTDGDMSVPGDLPAGVAKAILGDPNIVAWFTQNYDGSLSHPKLQSIPIGLGFHANLSRMTGVRGAATLFRRVRAQELTNNERIPRIWCDCHRTLHPRSALRQHPTLDDPRLTLATALSQLPVLSTVDTLQARIGQADLWERYASYKFVISLPGHGWDCYRTWEALGLGATVITIHSPLDGMLKDYRVIFLNARETKDWLVLEDSDWLTREYEKCINKPIPSLSWQDWIPRVRAPLRI